MIQYCWDVYLDDESQYNLPTVSPLTAPLSMLQGLPPAFILSCDQDVYYLAEDELYAKRLMSAGVAVTSVRYNNIDHGYLTMPQLTAYTMTSISHTAQILRDFWAPPRAKL
jgi:acetyl esterase